MHLYILTTRSRTTLLNVVHLCLLHCSGLNILKVIIVATRAHWCHIQKYQCCQHFDNCCFHL